jgi:hypothetical protein
MLLDKRAPRGLGGHRTPPFAGAPDGCFRRYQCRRHGEAVCKSILQIVGDVSCRRGAAAEIDAPFAGEVGDENSSRAQLVDRLHDKGGNSLIDHENRLAPESGRPSTACVMGSSPERAELDRRRGGTGNATGRR